MHPLGPGRTRGKTPGVGPACLALWTLVLLAGCATGPPLGSLMHAQSSAVRAPPRLTESVGGAGGFPTRATPPLVERVPLDSRACGGVAVPPDWPEVSSGDAEVLLAPFLTCASPGDFVALQERVDMPRLVEALDDWRAVRLGALGPVREDAAHLLQRKRAAFLVDATERYGVFHAEVFALFVLHTAHDDEVREVLGLLARDKRLGQTLGLMPAVREELEARGLPLAAFPERKERAGDVLRGLGRAARDALATSQTMDGLRYSELSARWARLPPAYQEAAQEVERALALRHFAPGSVAVGSFDAVTFGVPLGFYYLVVGTGQGAVALSRGEYERATRELAPALLLGALYAGGKGLGALSEARGRGLPEVRWTSLKTRVRELEARLGVEGVRALAREIQASREAGRFVAVGGVDAALAMREARGDVAKAQAMMSKAKPEATGAPAVRRGVAVEHPGGLAALVDTEVGLTREVVEARLVAVESETTGPRLSRDVTVLEKQRPSLEAPPSGARDNPRWREYVDYYEGRLGELREGKATKGPLRWAAYEVMWRGFARGLEFERAMVKVLRADAELPRAERRFLGDFDKPRVETYVGVRKPGTGLRFADVLVIEEGGGTGGPPRVETFSFKSRDLFGLDRDALKAQMMDDAREALRKYGGTLDIRRDSLQPLLREGSEVPIQRVRLVYEGGALKPAQMKSLDSSMNAIMAAVPEVEVLFQ
ncbi:hypothetical protein [Melittangium boletus]|uniref:Uncharacterized protein n=1 Tax=Melittangium boletus DSM 14713 TaxID=1294270 RepID=A0A250IF49_9BACT|nr:hypothetical protein [Melittangium boletus]ATB29850.1 hypothetical protein MEBOL_003305 [Melittangium boletus DSM 14713]